MDTTKSRSQIIYALPTGGLSACLCACAHTARQMATLPHTSVDRDPLKDIRKRLGRRGISNVSAVPGEWPTLSQSATIAEPEPFNGTSLPQLAAPHTSLQPPNGNLSWDYRCNTKRNMCTTNWACPESYWHIVQTGRSARRKQEPRGRACGRNLESSLYRRDFPGGAGDPRPTESSGSHCLSELEKNGPVSLGISAARKERGGPSQDPADAGESVQELARGIQDARRNHEAGALAALAGYY